MTKIYGNLADSALGDRRFARNVQERRKLVIPKSMTPKSMTLSPVTRMLRGLGLAIVGLTALAVLGAAPDRFAAATPAIADLEDWLIWRDLRSY